MVSETVPLVGLVSPVHATPVWQVEPVQPVVQVHE